MIEVIENVLVDNDCSLPLDEVERIIDAMLQLWEHDEIEV